MITPARIVAPICSLDSMQRALSAGADEVYCGMMSDDWAQRHGEDESISRRQGRGAHVSSIDELAAIARLGIQAGRPVALALNARYGRAREADVLRLAGLWEEMGGTAVMVTDLGLLLALQSRNSRLMRYLSVLAGTFNSRSVRFWAELGVVRVVLPRELTLAEMRFLVAGSPPVEFEAIAMYQKCRFIDGMCGFYHGLRLPSDVPAEFRYEWIPGEDRPVVWSPDPDYEGHGCQLCWNSTVGPVAPAAHEDGSTPACAACQLAAMQQAGVRHFKIAGRGYPAEMIDPAIAFLRAALQAQGDENRIRRLYADTFGASCGRSRCYYAAGDEGAEP